MLEENILQKVRSIIADVLEVSPEQVRENVNFVTDLGADSLRLLQILVRIEESFGITVEQGNLARMVYLESVSRILDEGLRANS